MLKFKQFLLEGIVDQINYSKRMKKEVLRNFNPQKNSSYIYDIEKPEQSTLVRIRPTAEARSGVAGDFSQQFSQDGTKIGRVINIYTDEPNNIFKPGSAEDRTLTHEFGGHGYQETKSAEKNPNRPFVPSTRYNNTPIRDDLSVEVAKQVQGSLSYNTDVDKEANARGADVGEVVRDVQNVNARRRVRFDPKMADFELDYEKSRGTLEAPELKNVEARVRSAGIDALNATLKDERQSTLSKKIAALGLKSSKDAVAAVKELDDAQKYVEKRAGAAVVDNQQNAEGSMRDEYSRLVTTPMRERHGRVQNTQAQVNQALLPSKRSGMILSPNTNFTIDMATNLMGLLTPPSAKDRMQIEKDLNTDIGLGFDLEGGELVASPEGFEAVRRRQKQGVKFPTAFPDNLYK